MALIEITEKRRVSLGRLGRVGLYEVREEPDGTLIWEPVKVVSEVEDRFRSAHPDVYAQLSEPVDDSATVDWADIRDGG